MTQYLKLILKQINLIQYAASFHEVLIHIICCRRKKIVRGFISLRIVFNNIIYDNFILAYFILAYFILKITCFSVKFNQIFSFLSRQVRKFAIQLKDKSAKQNNFVSIDSKLQNEFQFVMKLGILFNFSLNLRRFGK